MKRFFVNKVAKIVLTMSLATGSENEGCEKVEEKSLMANCASGDGFRTTLFTEVCERQLASNELDEAKDEEHEDICDKKHRKAVISSEFFIAAMSTNGCHVFFFLFLMNAERNSFLFLGAL